MYLFYFFNLLFGHRAPRKAASWKRGTWSRCFSNWCKRNAFPSDRVPYPVLPDTCRNLRRVLRTKLKNYHDCVYFVKKKSYRKVFWSLLKARGILRTLSCSRCCPIFPPPWSGPLWRISLRLWVRTSWTPGPAWAARRPCRATDPTPTAGSSWSLCPEIWPLPRGCTDRRKRTTPVSSRARCNWSPAPVFYTTRAFG